MRAMLASPVQAGQLGFLKFPLLASPKLDGVRCLILKGRAMSRTMKYIPNAHVQKLFGRRSLNGLDGELIVGPATSPNVYRDTMSGVMSDMGKPNVTYYVFDDFTYDGGFEERLKATKNLEPRSNIISVKHTYVRSPNELNALEGKFLAQGFEGVMLRHPEGPYKQGRSTLKEGWLLKLKRFVDAEARVVGFRELMHNHNKAVINELGYQERSSKKAHLKPAGVLGALVVKDLTTDVEFEIGSGFNASDRAAIWDHRMKLVGQLVKYKSQPTGVKDRPRFPVFLGWRDRRDL
jgi:DNA ligase 1